MKPVVGKAMMGAWLLRRGRDRGVGAALVVLALTFCLWSLAPAAAADFGCQGYAGSPGMCGESATLDPVPDVVPAAPPVLWSQTDWTRLPALPLPLAATLLHRGSSTPRAPPVSLA